MPRQITRALQFLRPHPHRGDLIAAGAVPLTVAVLMLNVRMNVTWGHGIHLVVTGLACALVLGMGLLAEPEGEFPRAYQTVLLLAGLALFAVTMLRLAQVFGSDSPLSASGTLTWMTALFAAVAAVPAWGRINSPICALVELLAGGVFVLALVDWVFSPQGPNTSRWILLLLILGYAALHLYWRERKRRHAVHFVNAAGLAAIFLGISFTFFATLEGVYLNSSGNAAGAGAGAVGPSTWWEIVLLAVGLGLVAYAAVDGEPGPGYLGFFVLLLFVTLAGLPGNDGASLIGWPLLLLLAGGAAVAAGLRPMRPLPPPPDAGDEPAPTQVLPARPGPGADESAE